MKEDKRRVYIRSWGCQMNVRDSEVICGLLKTENYQLTTNPQEADIILFNTCSVRQHAEDKVWSEIGRYQKPVTSNQKPIIGLVGCMAQAHKEKIFERAPQVDFVVGPSDIHKIPEIIMKVSGGRLAVSGSDIFERKIWETDGSVRPDEIYHTGFHEDTKHAYIVISEGCSNYCSYCVVPYVRGELRNRNYQDILREIEEAVEKGLTKITLLGQNVNAYKGLAYSVERIAYSENVNAIRYPLNAKTCNFIQLLEMVNNIKGLKEFSFITSHPEDTSLDLFRAMAEREKLKKYLHLPVQSGSDRILKLMNRGYTREFYLDLAENYRKIVKDAVLSTDIIVGFPTETDQDFQDTYNMVKEIELDFAFIFKYSVRPNTEAAKYCDDVSRQEKEKRHKIILDLQKKISKNRIFSRKAT
jgi:tRNA-2-methylthio-N6-dimethylallyladenosine synthase